MKKLLLFLILFFLFIPQPSSASQGCCSWHGGESYCDSTTGRWVCNDGTYSPTCTCGGGYYNYTLPTIAPLSTLPPIPTCPLMSLYNYATGQCECFSGYVFNGSYCISKDQSCTDKYGYNSTYDYLKDSCKCRYGYLWNSSGTKCISGDESCQNQIGIMSSYNHLTNTCDCFPGYVIQGGTCMPRPIQTLSPIYIPPVYVPSTPSQTPTPIPTPKPKIVVTPILTPTQSISPTPKISSKKIEKILTENKKHDPFWLRIIKLFFGIKVN